MFSEIIQIWINHLHMINDYRVRSNKVISQIINNCRVIVASCLRRACLGFFVPQAAFKPICLTEAVHPNTARDTSVPWDNPDPWDTPKGWDGRKLFLQT